MTRIGKAASASAAGLIAACFLGLMQPAAVHAHGEEAVIAGLVGLGIGAAIASDHPHYYRHRYYSHGYYGPPPPAYYAPPPYGYYGPPPGYYPSPRYGYYRRCGWRGCW